MVSAVVEIDLVSGFQTNPQPAGIELYAASWINHSVRVSVPESAELIGESSAGDGAAHTEIQDSAFYDSKDPDWTSRLNLRPKESMNQPEVGAESVGNTAAGNRGSLASFKVISHFAFQDDIGMNIEAHASAHSKHVGTGVLQPRVIEVDPKVTVVFVIFALRGCRWQQGRKAQDQDTKNCHSFHDLALLPSLEVAPTRTRANHELPRGTNSNRTVDMSITMLLWPTRWAGHISNSPLLQDKFLSLDSGMLWSGFAVLDFR